MAKCRLEMPTLIYNRFTTTTFTLFMVMTIIDRISSNDNVQEFQFAPGSTIEVATFLESDLVQSYSTRSRVECYTECSRKDNCLSISYQDGICNIFSTYPDTMNPILGVHYIIYEQWCDVLNGFIYIREEQLCYNVIKSNMSCAEAALACEQISASFIEIDSQETQIFVEEILNNEMEISGTFIKGYLIDDKWSRYDGNPLLYSNWDTTDPTNEQPNTYNDGACVGMDKQYQYYWHDYDVTFKKGVICAQNKPY